MKTIAEETPLKLVVMEGLPSKFTEERGGGFLEAIEGDPNIEVVATQPGDWEREKAMNVAQNLLQADSSINAFYCMSDEMSLGCAQAAKALGRDDVIICGIDGNENAMQAIKKGEVTSTLDVKPIEIGANAIVACAAAIEGKDCEKQLVNETKIVDASNVDEYLE